MHFSCEKNQKTVEIYGQIMYNKYNNEQESGAGMNDASVKLNPKEYSPLVLAYVGDSVYDLYVRTQIVRRGNRPVTELHRMAVHFVRAEGQAASVHALEAQLSEEELRVLKWGRNAKSHTSPKHADIVDYRLATGLETLFGYLYLEGDHARLQTLMELAYRANLEEE